MKVKNIITINKNKRNCLILDTIKGCTYFNKPGGCYGNCYAKKIFDRYNFDKSIVKRNFNIDKNYIDLFGFKDEKHVWNISKRINEIDFPFIRIGDMGDPSEDWNHTINICEQLRINKPIVIITKHIKKLTYELLERIEKINIVINTSISAMDSNDEIFNRLSEYKMLKKFCKSILRIVSCDFNLKNKIGKEQMEMQKHLFDNDNIIDTIFRPNINSDIVLQKIINIEKVKFLDFMTFASVYNKNTYFGYCNNCIELCGINIKIH
jgi:hypothetical protein